MIMVCPVINPDKGEARYKAPPTISAVSISPLDQAFDRGPVNAKGAGIVDHAKAGVGHGKAGGQHIDADITAPNSLAMTRLRAITAPLEAT